jgi:alpha-glucoside transport system substrate-binding protein
LDPIVFHHNYKIREKFTMKTRIWLLTSLMVLTALLLAACGPAPTAEVVKETVVVEKEVEVTRIVEATPVVETVVVIATPEPVETETPSTDFTGQKVTVLGNRKGPTAEQFRNALVPFEEQTGIEVIYEESTDFNTQLNVMAEGGNPPDIAIFPQPGFMKDLARAGKLKPLNDIVDIAELAESLVPGFMDLGSLDGTLYGAPYRANLKSLIWYPTKAFAEKGYTIPTTWDELLALSAQIEADGGVPWCFGVESGGATGWVITDWIEDIMLRTTTPENYDAWTTGELSFESPEVKRAYELFGEVAFHEGWVLGGRPAIVSINILDAGDPMLEDPPGCYLHKQGDFFAEFIPEEAKIPEDVTFFQFPMIDPQYGNPALGGGEFVSLLTDNPAAVELVRWLSTPEAGTLDAAAGGFLSPHKTFDLSIYPNEPIREQARILANSSVFRFDGGDLMPDKVQAGAFWPESVSWAAGQQSLEDTLRKIQASWSK